MAVELFAKLRMRRISASRTSQRRQKGAVLPEDADCGLCIRMCRFVSPCVGARRHDLSIVHESACVPCGTWLRLCLVRPGCRYLDRRRRQYAPGLEQVRNGLERRERARVEEDSRLPC